MPSHCQPKNQERYQRVLVARPQPSRPKPTLPLLWLAALGCVATLAACDQTTTPTVPADTHGPVAQGVLGELGKAWPTATDEQLKTFDRGKQVALHRYSLAEGLGPAYNVTFCTACHEKPTPGGSAGAYRNFFMGGSKGADGAYVPTTSAGKAGGVLRMYSYAKDQPARPPVDPAMNIIAQRNPIPFYGAGLIAELTNAEVLKREDANDKDGDGISGRANWDRGYVGMFGRKSQTVSIEAFLRGPLFNHAGVTSDPLTDAQRALLPVDSSAKTVKATAQLQKNLRGLTQYAQAAAPDGPTVDDDGVPDPEMDTTKLFDLVSFVMLMAGPKPEAETPQIARGRRLFDATDCGKCHTPRLEGKHGPLPVYSDLLLHDMGPDLADGVEQGVAKGNEFRTHPLWGIVADGPYLHDGRAATLKEAILAHGGEGQVSRDKAAKLTAEQMADLIEFLSSLGGRDQASAGLLPPNAVVPDVGAYGGPGRTLSAAEAQQFVQGRAAFDKDHGRSSGMGGPRFNGDSCRACHFDPIIGGSGPRDVNVMRHGLLVNNAFVPPVIGTMLHKSTSLSGVTNSAQKEATIFEHRQTPPLFGVGLIDAIDEATILKQADPDDLNGDGIRGRPGWADGHRLGRFGWKANVPSIKEFIRDATSMELGLTVPVLSDLTYGLLQDDDAIPDPEVDVAFLDQLLFFLTELAPPPRTSTDAAAETAGAQVFTDIGCAACHTPSLPSSKGAVPLYSDLLLHEIMAPGSVGIEEASAGMRDFRTAPLWGLAKTGPYMHSGVADTIEQSITLHDGEGKASRDKFAALPADKRAQILAFLGSL